jgi:6-phosphogluconolactonase
VNPTIVIDDLPRLQEALAREFATRARSAIANRGKFIVALPGGSVAATFFPSISRVALNWAQIEFFWTDERAVPPDDPESNYGLAARLLLRPAGVPAHCIHRMQAEAPDLEQAARNAADELKSIAGDPPRLDLALVGVGEDGHVASIFQRQMTSDSASVVLPVNDAPKPPPHRLSLTLNVLGDSERVVFAAVGRSKAVAVREAVQQGGDTPFAGLLRGSRSVLLLLDRAAGELLSGG